MNIVSHFNQLALNKIQEELATCKEFVDAQPYAITTTCDILPPEIIALGGRLEYWESDDSGKYYLAFGTQNPLTTNSIIGRHDDRTFFLSNINGEQHILRVTDQGDISIVEYIELLPETITKRLEDLGMA